MTDAMHGFTHNQQIAALGNGVLPLQALTALDICRSPSHAPNPGCHRRTMDAIPVTGSSEEIPRNAEQSAVRTARTDGVCVTVIRPGGVNSKRIHEAADPCEGGPP